MFLLPEILRKWLILAIFTVTILASGPTSIFINQVPEYSLLSSCPEARLSTVVRDMYSGCGDNKMTTSYACFCYQSSAIFSSIISEAVMVTCSNDTAGATTALEVFSSYCELGAIDLHKAASAAASTTVSSIVTGSAAPASTPTSVSPTGTAPSNKSSNSRTVAIAVGVSVPAGVIVISAIAFLLFRSRRKDKAHQTAAEIGYGTQVNELPHNSSIRELGEDQASFPPQELDSEVVRAELETPIGEQK
ncbi:hypothetical protein AOQ84DRAFT_403354 [Glonium stellatum]|uniref:Extracellular membrane protein CFEM domain-containing protein n=1 Tax=Glonium stellatum TaxID=574774 RepID=A0A8E2F3E6_9PEZI|nr:hypothetical protein AOQ84DRAFT_403354 [Glonium stellatum]